MMDGRRVSRFGIVALLLIAVLACNLPSTGTQEPAAPIVPHQGTPRPKATVAPTATTATDASPAAVSACSREEAIYDDVGFCYDSLVATSVQSWLLDAGEEEVLFDATWSMPERVQFGLVGYPMGLQRQGTSRIIVYPTEGIRNADHAAAEIVDEIERLLNERPSPATLDHIPVMAPVNAAQVYRARVAYLEEGDARGVRFLTAYAQDVTPVVNESLTYIYEGFIDGGSRFVVAWLYVYHDSLRDSWADYSAEEMDVLYDDYLGYLDEALANLEMQPADSFLPSLEALDAMMLSVGVRANP